jgi:hypothetical protein
MGKSNFEIFSSRVHGRWWCEIGKKGNQRGLIQGISLDTLDQALRRFEENYKDNPKGASRDFFYSLSRAQIISDKTEYFGDSTPTNIINARYIYEIFPESKFINMIRDGRDVALSVSKERWGPATPEKALIWWEKRIEHAHNSLIQIPQNSKLEIRLEELVIHQREESYSALLTFVGVDDHPTMRRYFDDQMVAEKMHSGEWQEQAKNPEKFGNTYQQILKRLQKKGIFIEKFY